MACNQTKFSAIGGVSKKTQIDYEKDTTSPTAIYLSAIAAAGADVSYILTGMRSLPPQATLAPDEAALLDNYRNSPPEGKQALEAMCTALTQPKRIRAGSKR